MISSLYAPLVHQEIPPTFDMMGRNVADSFNRLHTLESDPSNVQYQILYESTLEIPSRSTLGYLLHYEEGDDTYALLA